MTNGTPISFAQLQQQLQQQQPSQAPAVATAANAAPTAVPGVTGATASWDQPAYAQQPTPSAPAPRQPLPTPQFAEDQQPGVPPPFQQGPAQRGGAVKNALTRMLYGMGQAALQHAGLPTDYDIQRSNFEQALKQGQLQVDQAKQQMLEQGQQWQEQQATVITPWGPVQVPQKDLGKYQTGLAGYYRGTGAAETAAEASRYRTDVGAQTQAARYGFTVQNGQVVPAKYEDLSLPQQAAYDLTKSKMDPNSPSYRLAMMKLNMASGNLGMRQLEFQNRLQEQGLVKPSGMTQSRGGAAQAAMDMLPEIVRQINENRDQLGPVAGRINKWEGTVGDVDPNVAELYSNIKQLYSLYGAAHGWRAIQTPQEFEKAMGGLERNPDALIASLQGSAKGLQAIAQEGRTYRPRIVAPAGGGAGEAGGGQTAPTGGAGWGAQFGGKKRGG